MAFGAFGLRCGERQAMIDCRIDVIAAAREARVTLRRASGAAAVGAVCGYMKSGAVPAVAEHASAYLHGGIGCRSRQFVVALLYV